MKKLIYLLILSLCMNGLTGVACAWLQSARAEQSSKTKSQTMTGTKASQKKAKKEKADADKAADKKENQKKEKAQKEDEKSSGDTAKKTDSAKDKSGNEDKQAKAEAEYTLDLKENSQVLLSTVLKFAKLGIKLEQVKAIELLDKEDEKRIAWEQDEENEKDYVITVLKSFKALKLRIVTKKDSRVLVLLNGKKAKKTNTKEKQTKVDIDATVTAPTEAMEISGDIVASDDLASQIIGGQNENPDGLAEIGEDAGADDGVQSIPEGESKEKEQSTEKEQSVETGDIHGEADEPQSASKETQDEAGEGQSDGTDGEEPPKDGQDAPGGNMNEASADTDTLVDGQGNAAEGQGENPENQTGNPEGMGENPEGQSEIPGNQSETPEGQSETPENQAGNPEGQNEIPGNQSETPENQAGNPEGQNEIPGNQSENPEDQASNPEGENPEGLSEIPGNQSETPEDQSETPEGKAGNPEDQGENPEDQGEMPEDQGKSPQGGSATEIPAEAEAWYKSNGELFWGTLEAVIGRLTGGETVYIQTSNVIALKEAPLQLLARITLIPDESVFQGNYRVCVSADDPTLVGEPALLEAAQLAEMGDSGDLFVWVGQSPETPDDQTPDEEEDKPELVVKATDLPESEWGSTPPQFTLSGIPEGKEWSYAAIIYDERIVPITADTYSPDMEGVYTLRFAMLDELGDIVSASDQYTLQMDWTAPEVSIESDEEKSFTLSITATDAASGVDAVSVDAGKKWHKMKDGSYTVTMEAETTFAEGDIMVRDYAGNVFVSEEEYTVSEVEGEEGDGEEEGEEEGGGGGGGGGGGSGTPALPHASGDGEEGSEYDALTLDLPDEPMRQLTVGGEPMALTLVLVSAQESGAPVGVNQPFTATLRHWDDASEDSGDNTLVLDAEIDADLGDVFTYEWRFNGEVYRMLANSGIRYIALKVGDAVAAFPTEGFTGGTRYTELKMQGVSTRRFNYALTMKLNLNPDHISAMSGSDFSQECDLSIHAEVEDDKNYELSNSPRSMMYFYDVFVGPEDMMDQPFGEYQADA